MTDQGVTELFENGNTKTRGDNWLRSRADILACLTPRQREAAELLEQGCTHRVAGVILGISRKAVSRRMGFARRHLAPGEYTRGLPVDA